ncbi:DEAD/DEAH box helicase [Sphingomonas sp. MMS24-J13]|uniref:DEAD/DEAH box helicase n=1 Tax=Sphingomonas sp. MMS24-J13 TaxID=3238686 RepID=UPI00384FAFCA
MSDPDVHFEAAPDGDGETIRLVQFARRRLLGGTTKTFVPVEQWVSEAPARSRPAVARLLQAIGDDEHAADGMAMVVSGEASLTVHAALIAKLTESEASSLGLPPVARLALNLQSIGVAHQSDFRIETRWTKPNGLPAPVRLVGSRLKFEAKEWRVSDPIWTTLWLVDRLNGATGESERQSALAALRQAIGDDDRSLIKPDGFIERLRLSYAAGFSLDLKASATGFDFDPVLFSPDRMRETEDGIVLDEAADGLLAPSQQEMFARRFRQSDGTRRAYLLEAGSILFLDPSLQSALKIVREAQSGGAEQRREFARSPQRKIAEALASEGVDTAQASALFVETQQFSNRVSGIDIWRKPVLPWIKPKPNSWLPEAFGLRIGDPPDETMIALTPDQVEPVMLAVEEAIREDRATFSIDETELPATEQARAALTDLAEIVRAAQADPNGENTSPPVAAQRYFLQVRDNLEDVAYAPLAAAPSQPDEPPASLPATLKSDPKPHQVIGFNWLVSCWRAGMPGALLADDMGLGKTYQALAFLAWLRAAQPAPKPVLIVAPTGLLANWKAEIQQHLATDALGPVVSAYGGGLDRARAESGRDIELGRAAIDSDIWAHAGIVLTTYETMRDYHLSFARQPLAAIIYDEVQKLKNPASQMTRAGKTLNARFQLAMTGTPVENRLQDLWSVFDVIHPGLLGSSKAFESTYPSSESNRLRELNGLLTEPQEGRPPLLLRRMKDDCLPGLPAKHIHVLPVPMPPTQAASYGRVIQRAMAARGTGKRGNMLEILHMLRGVSLHPVAPEDAADGYFDQSARLRSTFDTLDTIKAKGEKALIFCESLAMQALLASEIRRRYGLDHDVPRIHGGVTGDARQIAVEQFQRRRPAFDVMILSPKAGGVGLTLTAANHVIHLSRWWNPAVEDQATDRVFRIGQTRDVHVYLPQSIHPDPILGPTSFDLKLDALMTRKRALSRGLLIPGEDEADTSALFEEVLGGSESDAGSENSDFSAASGKAVLAVSPAPGTPLAIRVQTTPAQPTRTSEPTSDTVPPTRPVLSAVQTAAPPAVVTAGRYVFEPNKVRDFAIFLTPIAGEHIVELLIKDPYACARSHNRQHVVDFAKRLIGAARRIDAVIFHTLDADSVENLAESDLQQQADLERRWRASFPSAPTLRHVQISKRINRNFHAREMFARFASGRTILWDLDNGIDGVMRTDRRCVVGCFPQ